MKAKTSSQVDGFGATCKSMTIVLVSPYLNQTLHVQLSLPTIALALSMIAL